MRDEWPALGLNAAPAPDDTPCVDNANLHARRPIRVAYLFTSFPLLSETFYQREIRALRGLPVEIDIYSLWGGGRGGAFEGAPVSRFSKWRLLLLPWWIVYWLARRPSAFARLASRIARASLPSPINAGETVLGLAFALCHARRFRRAGHRPDLIHAAWATMPATAAQMLTDLTGIPFSMGAHAYDVFRDGGDCLLTGKLRDASLIVTSSLSARSALLERHAPPDKTVLIRRGLDPESLPPAPRLPRPQRAPLRILAVGRLIEKKGYADQLAIYAGLKAARIPFEARIVGGGPLDRSLKKRAEQLGIADCVTFMGPLPHAAVQEQYAWADVLIFTGKVGADGDRDGLPNVIPEAMAAGVPVAAHAVGGVPEAIEDGRTGALITDSSVEAWLAALTRLRDDDAYFERLRNGAGAWVDANFNAHDNARRLLDRFEAVAARPVAAGRDLAASIQ